MQESRKKIWAKLCSFPLCLLFCISLDVLGQMLSFVEGLHLQGDANPLQLLSSVGWVGLEAREIFILSFAIGHRPGKMSDGTGDLGHFCTQGELIFLLCWCLRERGESFPLAGCETGLHKQDFSWMREWLVRPQSYPGM